MSRKLQETLGDIVEMMGFIIVNIRQRFNKYVRIPLIVDYVQSKF